ncbi:hypothetical protein AMAG_00362 [Allomyces macrogynus ATCC 38327]|uniref:HSF-type DNA-binding domain-containing protein n=1 Tax=Allomyces macrogynus (strain ATCC 38327) TaxID=578462 RepID=A0A0L0RVB1_ALLM3|nr:hypothetical protein AMAG_00362 [Allomyces macrogynus ATCC 38327]|eukprot:KNE54387.1 hypothetical protein AMAG_00362 [Allomyces macrogynus ATCC 38327]
MDFATPSIIVNGGDATPSHGYLQPTYPGRPSPRHDAVAAALSLPASPVFPRSAAASPTFLGTASPLLTPIPASSPVLGPKSFVQKVYGLVNDPATDHLICWTPAGTSFVVLDVKGLEAILPSVFKHGKFPSLIRQLNMYHFSKINRAPRGSQPPDAKEYEFAHEHFTRDGSRLALIKRQQAHGPTGTSTSGGTNSTTVGPHRLATTTTASANAAAANAAAVNTAIAAAAAAAPVPAPATPATSNARPAPTSVYHGNTPAVTPSVTPAITPAGSSIMAAAPTGMVPDLDLGAFLHQEHISAPRDVGPEVSVPLLDLHQKVRSLSGVVEQQQREIGVLRSTLEELEQVRTLAQDIEQMRSAVHEVEMLRRTVLSLQSVMTASGIAGPSVISPSVTPQLAPLANQHHFTTSPATYAHHHHHHQHQMAMAHADDSLAQYLAPAAATAAATPTLAAGMSPVLGVASLAPPSIQSPQTVSPSAAAMDMMTALHLSPHLPPATEAGAGANGEHSLLSAALHHHQQQQHQQNSDQATSPAALAVAAAAVAAVQAAAAGNAGVMPAAWYGPSGPVVRPVPMSQGQYWANV